MLDHISVCCDQILLEWSWPSWASRFYIKNILLKQNRFIQFRLYLYSNLPGCTVVPFTKNMFIPWFLFNSGWLCFLHTICVGIVSYPQRIPKRTTGIAGAMPGQCAMMQGWNTAALEPLPRNSRCVREGWLCVCVCHIGRSYPKFGERKKVSNFEGMKWMKTGVDHFSLVGIDVSNLFTIGICKTQHVCALCCLFIAILAWRCMEYIKWYQMCNHFNC